MSPFPPTSWGQISDSERQRQSDCSQKVESRLDHLYPCLFVNTHAKRKSGSPERLVSLLSKTIQSWGKNYPFSVVDVETLLREGGTFHLRPLPLCFLPPPSERSQRGNSPPPPPRTRNLCQCLSHPGQAQRPDKQTHKNVKNIARIVISRQTHSPPSFPPLPHRRPERSVPTKTMTPENRPPRPKPKTPG